MICESTADKGTQRLWEDDRPVGTGKACGALAKSVVFCGVLEAQGEMDMARGESDCPELARVCIFTFSGFYGFSTSIQQVHVSDLVSSLMPYYHVHIIACCCDIIQPRCSISMLHSKLIT